MYRKDPDFRDKVKNSKGFCLHHFGDLCEASDSRLPDKEKADFYNMLFPLMEQNLIRLGEDVAWMVEKFDYRNKDADWKNSKDAIQRGMQKLKGAILQIPRIRKNNVRQYNFTAGISLFLKRRPGCINRTALYTIFLVSIWLHKTLLVLQYPT